MTEHSSTVKHLIIKQVRDYLVASKVLKRYC